MLRLTRPSLSKLVRVCSLMHAIYQLLDIRSLIVTILVIAVVKQIRQYKSQGPLLRFIKLLFNNIQI